VGERLGFVLGIESGVKWFGFSRIGVVIEKAEISLAEWMRAGTEFLELDMDFPPATASHRVARVFGGESSKWLIRG